MQEINFNCNYCGKKLTAWQRGTKCPYCGALLPKNTEGRFWAITRWVFVLLALGIWVFKSCSGS